MHQILPNDRQETLKRLAASLRGKGLKAGIVATVLDSACGYAALSLMPPGVGMLSVEFKINLLAPAQGDLLIARGRVVRASRTISVCQADGLMRADGGMVPVAAMQATIMTVADRAEITG